MWFAHVTVANVVYKDGQFLMVKEIQDGLEVINQPAGHLEEGETLLEAVIRETLEETCWHIKPVKALGVSQFKASSGDTYIRHTFVSEALSFEKDAERDTDIIDACWMSAEEITAHASKLRSPLVLNDIQRFQTGPHFELNDMYFSVP